MNQFAPPEKTQTARPASSAPAVAPLPAPVEAETADAAEPAEPAPAAQAPPAQALAQPQLPPAALAGLVIPQPAPPAANAAPAAPPSASVATAVAQATPRAQPLRGLRSAVPADSAGERAALRPGEAETAGAADVAPLAEPVIAPAADQAAPVLSHKAAEVAPQPAAALPGDAVSAGSVLAQQSLETRLDVVRDAQWIDRAARDIAQLATGEGRLRFRLDPEQLGSLQIDLAQGADGVSLRMTAETEAARAILVDAQPKLLAEARAQGVRIAESHVDLGSRSGGEGRNAPPPPTMVARDRMSAGEAVAQAAPAGERFA